MQDRTRPVARSLPHIRVVIRPISASGAGGKSRSLDFPQRPGRLAGLISGGKMHPILTVVVLPVALGLFF
jgi:hypothetical protein